MIGIIGTIEGIIETIEGIIGTIEGIIETKRPKFLNNQYKCITFVRLFRYGTVDIPI